MTDQKYTQTFRQFVNERARSLFDPSDPEPMEVPIGAEQPLSLKEEMQRFIRTEISQAAQVDGHETEEEANDFEPEDEELINLTAYELTVMQAEIPISESQAPQEADLPAEGPPDQPDTAESAEAPQEKPQTEVVADLNVTTLTDPSVKANP